MLRNDMMMLIFSYPFSHSRERKRTKSGEEDQEDNDKEIKPEIDYSSFKSSRKGNLSNYDLFIFSRRPFPKH